MKKVTLICMALLAMVAMVSCRGPQGPAGQDGNANVASATVTIPSQNPYVDWQWINYYYDGDGNPRGEYMAEIGFSAINSNVFNHGAVLVYMNTEGTWSQLPLTYPYYVENNGMVDFYSATIETATLSNEGVRLFWKQNDFWKEYPGTRTFKVVAIEATYFDSRSDVDYSNYESVKAAFQLED